jgi:lysozyme
MNLAAARALVARHEGLRLKPYVDTVGKITIGYGYNLTDRGISRQTADAWLDADLATCVDDLSSYPWFAALTDNRQTALLDLIYNVGPAGFSKFRRLIAALHAHDYARAAAEILDSEVAPLRARELADLMRTG